MPRTAVRRFPLPITWLDGRLYAYPTRSAIDAGRTAGRSSPDYRTQGKKSGGNIERMGYPACQRMAAVRDPAGSLRPEHRDPPHVGAIGGVHREDPHRYQRRVRCRYSRMAGDRDAVQRGPHCPLPKAPGYRVRYPDEQDPLHRRRHRRTRGSGAGTPRP